jgi:hypothetical protein
MSLRSHSLRFASLALLTVPASLLLAACGGKIDGSAVQTCAPTEFCGDTGTAGDDGSIHTSDTGITGDDGSTDTMPDAPFECGKGPCVAGTTCAIDACTQAFCVSDGSWAFSDSCPPDAGGCPTSLPSSGAQCGSAPLKCDYPTSCGIASAYCGGGGWLTSTPTCPPPPSKCPISEPAIGTPCDPTLGKSCNWGNACGSIDYGLCDPTTGLWQISSSCTTGCPASEPMAGSACTTTASCSYISSCGGTDDAKCSGGRWYVAIGPCASPGCPVAVPKLGDGCSTVGQACYWPCDKAYCSITGWIPTNNTCGVCPGLEPPNGSSCAPNGIACGWANKCGGTDSGTCNGGRWNISGGTCSVPTCPATRPNVGFACASNGLGCEYGNGCGGIDWYYCSGTWQMKGPSPCNPGCPSGKPTTGAPCMIGTGSSCQYVTDPIAQCTSGCFCTDVGTWTCTAPSCSGLLPPIGVEAGVSDGGIGAAG